MKKTIGLYIHVPFCLSKCPYCDFYSVKYDTVKAEAYTGAVCRAIETSVYGGRPVDSIYFGGGTPPLLGVKNLSRIIETFERNFCFINPEITLEANPSDISASELASIKAAGFNRISFGVQSGADNELKALGRRHNARQAGDCIRAAGKAGFKEVSADLMLGIPYQTAGSLRKSIAFLTEAPLSHISAYMLKIEKNTPFASGDEAGLCPQEDALAEMYLDCVSSLERLGFKQYEISNFAKKGAKSRHNLKYWYCEEYLGIGPSAHSFIDGERFFLTRGLDDFIAAKNPFELAVKDGKGGDFEEYAMLRLRLCEGLDLKRAGLLYGIDTAYIAENARALEQNSLVTNTGGVIALTSRGFLLSNAVTAALLFN